MALLVGLTGGMGSGKTTVANLFKALGAHIIDADEISRSLVEPGQPAWQEIVDRLGTQVIREDQSLDRKKIADLVFENPEECKILEN
ncbi:MAG: dephospho-CoA kinase, partial [Nitrospinaceae bacterium]|nr:dephospho-CoA kinase [Nitrospinaceae bacterium]NIR55827.1 dephospho-CoA kinase [Nitrospinaceae bacterium]NIS86280.1 dephospho-CoA kinase [Nitrospinaceae bacterium]NIT83109.1 dephospho-CoA kinase [Nitrospinaceae bacterium]NIU45319.1 dephospho-CoA kinase [Nitrospinaceae bacterium]